MKSKKLNLAEERTMLAGIRTSLSFVRTALACLSVAFAFIKLDKQHPIDALTISLFVFSAIFFTGAVFAITITKGKIKNIQQLNKNSTLQEDSKMI